MTIQIETSAVFRADVGAIAYTVEQIAGDALKPAPHGIYLPSCIEPVAYFTDALYMKIEGIIVPVTDVYACSYDVYRCIGGVEELIIPARFLRSQAVDRYVSSRPFYPLQGLTAIRAVIRDVLSEYVAYPFDDNPSRFSIYECFTLFDSMDVASVYEAVDHHYLAIRDLLEDIIDELQRFIAKSKWNLFDIRFVGNTLMVRKQTDWRAVKWLEHLQQQELQRELLAQE